VKIATLITAGIGMFVLGSGCADYDELDDPDRKPEAVDLEIIRVTDSTVTLRWTRNNEEDFRQYAVYYGINEIVDRDDNLDDSLSYSDDTVKTVGPLDDLVHYYFRVMVYNERGNFRWSNTVDTTTPENMKGKIKLGTPERTGLESVRLRWSAAAGVINRYTVYGDTMGVVDTNDQLFSTIHTDTTSVIEGLGPGRTWWFRVYAWNDTALAATSNIVKIGMPAQ
jgi:hypothetical protein